MTAIHCAWVYSYTDYDGTRGSHTCPAIPTWHIVGVAVGSEPVDAEADDVVDVYACPAHKGKVIDDVTGVALDAIDDHYRQGYEQAHAEAQLAVMSTQTAWAFINLKANEELPSGFDCRTPLTAEWGDEVVDWEDEHVESYRRGFRYGWLHGLVARASIVMGQIEDLDD